MWYPNKAQWWVIWIAALLAMWTWIEAADTGYRSRSDVTERVAGSIIIIGGLLVWQLARFRQKP